MCLFLFPDARPVSPQDYLTLMIAGLNYDVAIIAHFILPECIPDGITLAQLLCGHTQSSSSPTGPSLQMDRHTQSCSTGPSLQTDRQTRSSSRTGPSLQMDRQTQSSRTGPSLQMDRQIQSSSTGPSLQTGRQTQSSSLQRDRHQLVNQMLSTCENLLDKRMLFVLDAYCHDSCKELIVKKAFVIE